MSHYGVQILKFWVFCALFCSIAACSKRTVWVYTSLPKEQIAEMVGPLKTAIPDVEVKWYQSKIESIASRFQEETLKKEQRADLVIGSDPFWFMELKQSGKLYAYDSSAAQVVSDQFKDPEHAFVAVKLSLMIMAYQSVAIKSDFPQKWKDLTESKWKGKFSMGNPLESFPSLLSVALLSRLYGWEYFSDLKKLGIFAEGSSSSVLKRIEVQERPVGAALLENVIRAQKESLPIHPIYPLDGPIVIPYPIAILKNAAHLESAKKVYDWFFSPAAQEVMVKAGGYSPIPGFRSPEFARPWNEIQSQVLQATPEMMREFFGGRDQIKAKFSDIVFH